MWLGPRLGGTVFLCLPLVISMGVASARAQESTVVPTIGEAMTVVEIQECLCAQERIAAERLALELQQGAIEDREAALQVLNERPRPPVARLRSLAQPVAVAFTAGNQPARLGTRRLGGNLQPRLRDQGPLPDG